MLNNRALAVPDSVPKRMGPERNTRLSRGRRRAGLAAWVLLVVALAHLLPPAFGYHSPTSRNEVPDNLEIQVKMGVLGLKKPMTQDPDPIMTKCDKVLYEQVALRLALDHISTGNDTVMDLSSMIPARIQTDPIYVGKSVSEIIGNVTMWAKNNIESCAKHEILYDLPPDKASAGSIMLHDSDNLPNTVDILLGPRDSLNYECQMMRQIASLGRLPMVTWGCTSEQLGMLPQDKEYFLNTTTISMLPEDAENLQAHAIMDFLHDHKWDQGHVAVIYCQHDTKSLDLIQKLMAIVSCGMSPHGVRIHPYGMPMSDGTLTLDGIESTLDQIRASGHNILLSTLEFRKMPQVLYSAWKKNLVGSDNIWIHTKDFTPTQLEVASTTPLSKISAQSPVAVEEGDEELKLGPLLHGSFSIGWTPGGADYTKGSNPWERFKKVWSEQRLEDYPDLPLPDYFFDYPPLSANAALVYDSAWIGLVSYLHELLNNDSVFLDSEPLKYDMGFHNHSSHAHGSGDSSVTGRKLMGHSAGEDESEDPDHIHIDKDFSPNEHNHHAEDDGSAAHMHVCATSDSIPGGLTFQGVTGPVHINKATKARAPVANLIRATNLQWNGSLLMPYMYGHWPYTWHNQWDGACVIPDHSLWQTRQQPTSLKYGSLDHAPEYRSKYSTTEKTGERSDTQTIIIAVLCSVLGLLMIGMVFLIIRYRTAHKKVIQNEKVAKDFQFEWETNAGKALTMLSSLIETMGDKREGGRESKESFERKLSQIRRFLLAQDARVEMNQVKSSIQRVGNERYTPEVTAYLMEQALNASTERLSGEESVYKRSNSFERKISKTSIENVLQKSMSANGGFDMAVATVESPASPMDMSEMLKRSFSSASSSEALEVISPVVDSVILEQVKTKLISNLNLAAIGDTSFNVFELATLTGDRPLSTLSLFLLHRRGVCSALKLKREKLMAFVVEVENMMFDHPYHNRRHVADVVAGIYAFTVPGGCLYDYVQTNPLAMLAAVFAATIHDLQHPGVNNNFLSKTLHPLAIKHSDKSVNESHHLSCAFDLMSQDDFNFMEDRVEIEDFLTFRTLVIEMVLATDMKSHFGILDKFKRFQKARQEDPNSVDIPTEMNSAFAIAIKTADLIHCSRPLEVHHRWVDLITQEFCNQGDLEKARNMPVSPGMDRLHPPGALQQVGFTEIFVLPLFKAWREYAITFGSQGGKKETIFYEGVEKNYQYWLHTSKCTPTEKASV